MKYLNDYIDDEMSKTFKKYGVFFAFSNKQYKEQAKEDIKYISYEAPSDEIFNEVKKKLWKFGILMTIPMVM